MGIDPVSSGNSNAGGMGWDVQQTSRASQSQTQTQTQMQTSTQNDIVSGVASLGTQADKQVFGAQVVAKTLDYMNQNQSMSGGANADYDFQTKVLSAAGFAKGMFDLDV